MGGDGRVLRPTIIRVAEEWTKWSQTGLIGDAQKSVLAAQQQQIERDGALDFLDTLCRSGSLPVEFASMHVMFAGTHCFDHSLFQTLIQDNVNPIEAVEQSSLVMASTIHDRPLNTSFKYDHLQQGCQLITAS